MRGPAGRVGFESFIAGGRGDAGPFPGSAGGHGVTPFSRGAERPPAG